MKCSKCGALNADNSSFCTKCGANLKEQNINPFGGEMCPGCGNALGTYKFCTRCGYKVEEAFDFGEVPVAPKKKKSFKGFFKVSLIVTTVAVCIAGGIFGIKYLTGNKKSQVEYTGSYMIDCSNIEQTVKSVEDAYSVLNSVSEIFGYENAEEDLDVTAVKEVDGDTYYRFEQNYEGVKVYGSDMVVSAAEGDGDVFNIGGNYKPIPQEFSTVPKINADKALKSIEKYADKKLETGYSVSESEVIVYCGSGTPVLAYKASVMGYDKDGVFCGYDIFVNADNGKVVGTEETVMYAQKQKSYKGQDGNKYAVMVDVNKTSNGDSVYIMMDTSRKITVSRALNQHYWFEDVHDGNETKAVISWVNNEEADASAVDAMYNVASTYDFYDRSLNHIGMDGKGSHLPVLVRVSGFLGLDEDGNVIEEEHTDNAMFLPAEEEYLVFFVKTDGTYEYSADLDVVAHEYTHGVTHGIVEASGQIAGYIDEAYSDIMGNLIEAYYSGSGPDWIMADARNLKTPSNNGFPTHKSDYDESEGAYYNSSILSHASYLMWNGVRGDGPALMTQNGVDDSIYGIRDVETLAKLWYGSLYMLNPDSTFSDCRVAVETSAQRLYSKGEITKKQLEGVSNAFDTVGIDSVTYELVTSKPELVIYAADNSKYYNYSCRVDKVTLKNLYSLTKGVETTTSKLTEFKVEKVQTVSLNDVTEESPAISYAVVIENLSASPKTKHAKILKVSTKSNAKNQVSFYTDYEQDIEATLKNVANALKDVQSVNLKQKSTSDNTFWGHRLTVSTEAVCKRDHVNGLSHTKMSTYSSGINLSTEMYTEEKGKSTTAYMKVGNLWFSKEKISSSDIDAFLSGFVSLDTIKLYLASIEDARFELSNGNDIVISGVLNTSKASSLLESSGAGAILKGKIGDVLYGAIDTVLRDLAPMEVVFYIDSESFLPKRVVIDKKAAMETLYSAINSYIKTIGFSVDYNVICYDIDITLDNYNNADSIVIPSEATSENAVKIDEIAEVLKNIKDMW